MQRVHSHGEGKAHPGVVDVEHGVVVPHEDLAQDPRPRDILKPGLAAGPVLWSKAQRVG